MFTDKGSEKETFEQKRAVPRKYCVLARRRHSLLSVVVTTCAVLSAIRVKVVVCVVVVVENVVGRSDNVRKLM